MKKVLLATTILAASAGFAAADVTVTGTARMGVAYNEANVDNELSFTNRVRIIFTASGETDGGLSFGASVRADNADEANDNGTTGTVFISGAFGTITMGDVDDAFGALFGDIAGVGLTGLGDFNELNSSADGGAFALGDDNGAALGLINTNVFADGVYDAIRPLQARGFNLAADTVNPADPGFVGSISGTAALIEDVLDQAGGAPFSAAAHRSTLETIATVFPGDARIDVDGDTLRLDTGSTADERISGFNGAVLSGLYDQAVTGATNPARIASFEALLSTIAADFGVDQASGLGFSSPAPSPSPVFGTNVDLADIEWTASSTLETPEIAARVLYTYTMDGFSVALGYSQTGPNEAGSIAASYATGGLTVSAGYAKANWENAYNSFFSATAVVTGVAPTASNNVPVGESTVVFAATSLDAEATDLTLGARYEIDNLTLAAVYQDRDFDIGGVQVDNQKTTGVSVSYTMDALGVSAFYSQTDSDLGVQDARAYGIGASYDLGGGASVVGGIVDRRGFTGGSNTTADLGVSFTF